MGLINVLMMSRVDLRQIFFVYATMYAAKLYVIIFQLFRHGAHAAIRKLSID